MNVKEIKRKNVDWFHLAKYREYLEGCRERTDDPPGFISSVEFLDRVRNCGFSRRGFAAWNYVLLPRLFLFSPCF